MIHLGENAHRKIYIELCLYSVLVFMKNLDSYNDVE
jgi:hypothetical protein